MSEFKDKVVVITGAGGGVGKAHALEFARRGAKVVVNDLGGSGDGHGSSDMADVVVDEIKQSGGIAKGGR
jgi:NAD(P)-dependent dehydrogenase (short-subunit alcohol dehydrogenase family)